MRIRIAFTTLFLFCIIITNAQKIEKEIPEKERDAWFYYKTFEYKSKPMVAFVSSYIFRNKYDHISHHTLPSSDYLKTIIKIGMHDKMDYIDFSSYGVEKYVSGSELQIGTAHWNVFATGAPEPKFKNTTNNTNRSTTSYIIAIRESVIEDLKKDGYTVYQIDFKENYTFKLEEKDYLKSLEHIEKLSTLTAPIYQTGDFERAYNKAKENEDETKKKKEQSKIKSEDSKSNFSSYCFNLSYDIIQKYQYYKTQSNQINQPLVTRQMLLEKISNYQNECPAQASRDQDVINIYNELNYNIEEGLSSAVELFTSSPWSIGYGQFLDSKNGTYFIRLGLGFATADYEGTFAKLSWQINTNFVKLPTRSLIYKFHGNDGVVYESTTKSDEIDDIKGVLISLGPTLTFWPHKNIFLQIAPEVYGGYLRSDKDDNFPMFSVIPGGDAKLGFRFGKVYISGSYGMLFKKFNLAKDADYKAQETTLNFNGSPVKGKWVAGNYDHEKWLKHSFWTINLGFNF